VVLRVFCGRKRVIRDSQELDKQRQQQFPQR